MGGRLIGSQLPLSELGQRVKERLNAFPAYSKDGYRQEDVDSVIEAGKSIVRDVMSNRAVYGMKIRYSPVYAEDQVSLFMRDFELCMAVSEPETTAWPEDLSQEDHSAIYHQLAQLASILRVDSLLRPYPVSEQEISCVVEEFDKIARQHLPKALVGGRVLPVQEEILNAAGEPVGIYRCTSYALQVIWGETGDE